VAKAQGLEARMMYVLGYFGIGIALLFLAVLINNLFKLRLFYEDYPEKSDEQNGLSVAILFVWPLMGVVFVIFGFVLGVMCLTGLLIREKKDAQDTLTADIMEDLDKEFPGRTPE
jgi:hypothetical protein